jgi:tRNA splicing ligase
MDTYDGLMDSSEQPGGETTTLQRLSVLDKLFEASGFADIKVMRGGKEHMWRLPIQSVDNEMVEALARPYRPKTPIKRELIAGKWTTVVNEFDQEYQDKLTEYNRAMSYLLVFCGLAVDITDEHNQIVWSVDNQVRNLDDARRIVKKMGLVDNHIVTIMRAIRELTAEVEETQAQE